MNLCFRIFIIGIILFGLAACKKKKQEEPKPDDHTIGLDCGMLSMVRFSPGGCKDSTSFLGQIGRMSEMWSFDNCSGPVGGPGPIAVSGWTFLYEADKIFVADPLNDRRDTLILQPGTRRILEIHHGGSQLGGISTFYQYSANGELKREFSVKGSTPESEAFYSYENGDLTMKIYNWNGNSDTTIYTYYTDQKFRESAALTQVFQEYGPAYTVRNAHLLKSYSYKGRPEILFSYETGSFGNISKVIRSENGNLVDSTIYNYICIIE